LLKEILRETYLALHRASKLNIDPDEFPNQYLKSK